MYIINSQKVKELRKHKGLSQNDMAVRLNIEQATYCKIENGATALLADMMVQIAEVLKLNPLEILKSDSPPVYFNDHAQNNGTITGNVHVETLRNSMAENSMQQMLLALEAMLQNIKKEQVNQQKKRKILKSFIRHF